MSIKNDILDNLITALKTITPGNGYNTDVRTVSRFSQASDMQQESTPAVYIYETGERTNMEAETEIQYTVTGYLIGIIKNLSDLESRGAALASDIQRLIYSPPSLGTYALDVQITDSEVIMSETEKRVTVSVIFEIIYYITKGNTAATLTGPYGDNDPVMTGKSKLYDQLLAAKAAMAGLVEPDIDYLYDRHQKASMRLNAISIDFVSADRAMVGNGSSPIIQHEIFYSIRAHTQYRGRYNDNEINARLLESIANWLNAHLDLGDGYRIANIGGYESNAAFAESATVGGQLDVTLKVTHEYAQA